MRNFMYPLLVLILMLAALPAFGQADPLIVVSASWDNSPADENVDYYNLYLWQGDTIAGPFAYQQHPDSVSSYQHSIVDYDSALAEVSETLQISVEGKYLQVGLTAVNDQSIPSLLAASNTIKIPPSIPGQGTVEIDVIMQLFLEN